MSAERDKLPDRVHSCASTLSHDRPLHVFIAEYERPVKPEFDDMHYSLELGVVLQGQMIRTVEKTMSECGPGDFWVSGMYQIHGYRVISAPCRVVVVDIWPPLLSSRLFPEAPTVSLMSPFTCRPGSFPILLDEARREILEIGTRLASSCSNKKPAPRDAIMQKLLLFELLLKLPTSTQPSTRTAAVSDYEKIAPAIEEVLASRGRVACAHAARLCSMSESNFASCFRRSTGQTFADFDLKYRIESAASDIASTDQPLKSIAESWGFSNQSHLTRLFNQYFRKTPSAYRTSMH